MIWTLPFFASSFITVLTIAYLCVMVAHALWSNRSSAWRKKRTPVLRVTSELEDLAEAVVLRGTGAWTSPDTVIGDWSPSEVYQLTGMAGKCFRSGTVRLSPPVVSGDLTLRVMLYQPPGVRSVDLYVIQNKSTQGVGGHEVIRDLPEGHWAIEQLEEHMTIRARLTQALLVQAPDDLTQDILTAHADRRGQEYTETVYQDAQVQA
jgi:hypothetical protein